MFQCWATLGPTSIHRWSMSFIGVIMYMSVVHLPSTLHYWSEGTYIEKVASLLTCNKFEEIKRFLHFFDKTKELPKASFPLHGFSPWKSTVNSPRVGTVVSVVWITIWACRHARWRQGTAPRPRAPWLPLGAPRLRTAWFSPVLYGSLSGCVDGAGRTHGFVTAYIRCFAILL